jgi:GMP synthase (glutamine-hydrolysing)
MILVLDLTSPDHPILVSEFVRPVTEIIREAGYQPVCRRIEDPVPAGITTCIICGTALADNWYLDQCLPESLLSVHIRILGICAGMHLLLRTCGGQVIPSAEIGMIPIRSRTGDPLLSGRQEFSGYALHTFSVKLPDGWEVLASSDSSIQIVRSLENPWYGILFHPEVRNEWIIERFCRLDPIPDGI